MPERRLADMTPEEIRDSLNQTLEDYWHARDLVEDLFDA